MIVDTSAKEGYLKEDKTISVDFVETTGEETAIEELAAAPQPAKEPCSACGGTGGKSCSICNGKGVVSDDCILCHGEKACTACGGTGTK